MSEGQAHVEQVQCREEPLPATLKILHNSSRIKSSQLELIFYAQEFLMNPYQGVFGVLSIYLGHRI